MSSPPNSTSEQSNLQRIQEWKAAVKNWPLDKKLRNLAKFSACKGGDSKCECNGWKNSRKRALRPTPNPPRSDSLTPSASPSDPCRICNHPLSDHVKHLQGPNVSTVELDRLLSIIVDAGYLFMCVQKEEDIDTKQVYLYLFNLLRQSILQLTEPQIDGPIGAPPFEKPSIAKGVTNFVLYKFSHLPLKDWHMMYDMAKMFLHYLNHWKMETPNATKRSMTAEEHRVYKLIYPRWLCYCHVPAFCDSLAHYETTLIFGRTLLKSVFTTFRKQSMDRLRLEKDKIPPEKRTLTLTHFPRFLSLLEEEIYSAKSPIWDVDFKQAPPPQVVGLRGLQNSNENEVQKQNYAIIVISN